MLEISDLPKWNQLVKFVIQAVDTLGESASKSEILDQVLKDLPNSEELMKVTYPHRPNASVLVERIGWVTSSAYLSGCLERPARATYIITQKGHDLAGRSDAEIDEWINDFEREYNRKKRLEKAQNTNSPAPPETAILDQEDESEESNGWKEQLLGRLHRMSPTAFEKYIIFLLKQYGLELQHVAGPGDEGIDAIGTAPLSPVLSSRVAIQIKRYDPNNNTVGREAIALFQNDARIKGAERAIFVTLSRFTQPAKKAARQATPNIELIGGDRLCELIKESGTAGVRMEPVVNEAWFDQFD
ncbi:restriction endonuclease [Corynebacterium belfantii]|uniref:restriction endonuclease n=1 Tax=Corynebacterium belfantii TaxID=2014537 RepID=UPI0018D3642A|nr:Mrr restriction system protein [Corynebacterium belfantii]MBG9331724.1 restriction endonuclease [Corynebacterium belfantii]